MKSHPSRLVDWQLSTLMAGAAFAAMIVTSAPAAAGTTWWVTNQGMDTASCGTRPKPCRSISAAVEKALAGDVIEVGAGLYGDLNGDGAFTAPGEEHFGTDNSRHHMTCIICVDKAIKILSLHGADDTIIDAGNGRRADPTSTDGVVNNVISFGGSGATLGAEGAGFTITGSGGDGVHVQSTAASATIIGNIAQGNRGSGFAVEIVDASPPPFPVPLQTYVLKKNSSIHNAVGFLVSHDESRGIPELAYLVGNTAADNASDGFLASGRSFQLQLIGNVSSHNGAGIHIGDGVFWEIRGNSLIGNLGPGILLWGVSEQLQITGNTIVGNIGAGVYLVGATDNNVIRGNNIYGNTGAPLGTIPSVNPANCGVANIDVQVPLDATNNYWGSAAGPGADPADNAGLGCDFFGGKTIVKPFASTLFGISP